MGVVFLTSITIIASLLTLKYMPAPWLWLAVQWFLVFLYATITEKRPNIKPIWFNIGFLIIALAGFEAFFWVVRTDNTRVEGSYTNGYFTSDPILGYGPTRGKAVSATEYERDNLVYDVVYTIDSYGLRISPDHKTSPNDECVLFFGGSITFAQGVNDHEAMPYVVGTKSSYGVHNFGFHGYGPHQMLAALEQGIVKEVIECQPKFAIYQAIDGHVARSAGYASWDKHGPRYVLLPNGQVKFAGRFNDEGDMRTSGRLTKKLLDQLEKSYIYDRYFTPRLSKSALELFLGIVETSKERFLQDYPGGNFQVIFWDAERDKNERILIDGLKARGIRVHLISDVLAGYPYNSSIYQLSPNDRHPNPLAHRLIAEYVIDQILDGHGSS